jgi:hypothetical protein
MGKWQRVSGQRSSLAIRGTKCVDDGAGHMVSSDLYGGKVQYKSKIERLADGHLRIKSSMTMRRTLKVRTSERCKARVSHTRRWVYISELVGCGRVVQEQRRRVSKERRVVCRCSQCSSSIVKRRLRVGLRGASATK